MRTIGIANFLALAVLTCSPSAADWVDISGEICWRTDEALPERPLVDVSQSTSHIPRAGVDVREFGWVVDPRSRAVSGVVVFVRKPKRIHPDFPQDTGETRDAFVTFFRKQTGRTLAQVKSLRDLPSPAALDFVPSVVVLRDLDFKTNSIAIRAGQPVIVVNQDTVTYCLTFFGMNASGSEFCKPNEITSHDFSDFPRNGVSCTIHPWTMLSVSVFDHPYFDTSDSNGRFCISRVPAGEIELCALFWEYSIDLGSGRISRLNLSKTSLKLNALEDHDIGTITLHGWLPK